MSVERYEFFQPRVYNAPVKWVPIGKKISVAQKLERSPYQNVKSVTMVCIRLDKVPGLEGRTD